MTQAQQPEAPLLKLAAVLDSLDMGWSADVVRQAHAENTTLQQGYDAARLEIEARDNQLVKEAARTAEEKLRADRMTEQHRMQCQMRESLEREIEALQARIKAMAEERADELMVAHLDGRMRAGQHAPVMFNGLTEEETMNTASYAGLTTKLAGEYPPLPEPYHVAYDDIDKEDVKCFTEGQLRAYVDADRAMRAAQPEGAQQPGTAYAELPQITADDRSFLHYNPNTDDVVKWVLDYARAAITADRAMLAQAAPAAVAGQSEREAFEAYWAQCNAPLPMNTRLCDDGRYGDQMVQAQWEAWQARAAAPTTQAAPVAQGDALSYEQSYDIRQGHEIASSDAYFKARPQIDGLDRRNVFRAGFERGWDAARAQAKEGGA